MWACSLHSLAHTSLHSPGQCLGRVQESPFSTYRLPAASLFSITLTACMQNEMCHLISVSGNGCSLHWHDHQKKSSSTFSSSLLAAHSHPMLILLAQTLLQPYHKTRSGNRSGWKSTIFPGLIFKPDHFPIFSYYTAPQAAVPVQMRRHKDKNE